MERTAKFLTQLYNTVPCGILQFTTDPQSQACECQPDGMGILWLRIGSRVPQRGHNSVSDGTRKDMDWVLKDCQEIPDFDGAIVGILYEGEPKEGWINPSGSM